MYKCRYCHEEFDDPVRKVEKDRYDGFVHKYYSYFCPYCDSEEIEKAELCELCEDYVFADEIYDGICENCLKDYAENNLSCVCAYGDAEKDTRSINGVFSYLLDDEEINAALCKVAMEKMKEGAHIDYCMDDKDAFAEFLKNWLR